MLRGLEITGFYGLIYVLGATGGMIIGTAASISDQYQLVEATLFVNVYRQYIWTYLQGSVSDKIGPLPYSYRYVWSNCCWIVLCSKVGSILALSPGVMMVALSLLD